MSNLIAIKDASNDIGLGTSFIGLGTLNDTSILPFKKDDGTILMNFNTTNNSINLGTISSGTWQGTAIGTSYGGTGLTTIGSAGQVLSVKSDNSGLEWTTPTSGGSNTETSTNIATTASSSVGIGSSSQDLTITGSSLQINIGDTVPSDGQVLKYTDNSVSWQNSSSSDLSSLFNLMNLFHPGYVTLLKSIEVKIGDVSQTLIPEFNINTRDYSIVAGSNYSVSILPTTFSSSSSSNLSINDNAIANPNIYNITNSGINNPSIFTIINSLNTSVIYTLSITRNDLNDANLKNMTITSTPAITFDTFSENTQTYNIDVASNLSSFTMKSEVHSTASYISISTTQNNNTPSSLAIPVSDHINLFSYILNKTITPIYVYIKAEDNTPKQYTFDISRPPRNTTTLDTLQIKKIDYDDNETDSSVYNLDTTVTEVITDNNIKYIKFIVNKNHNRQKVYIKNDSDQVISTLNKIPENPSTSISILNVSQTLVTTGGTNGASETYKINITAPDNTTNSTDLYSFRIKRLPSTLAELGNIKINSIELTNFSGSTTNYAYTSIDRIIGSSTTLNILSPSNIFGQSIEVKLNDNIITINNNEINPSSSNDITLTGLVTTVGSTISSNPVEITVTAQDNSTTKVYNLDVYRKQEGNTITSYQYKEGTGTNNNISDSDLESIIQVSHETFTIIPVLANDSTQATVEYSLNEEYNSNSINPYVTLNLFPLIAATTYAIYIRITSEKGDVNSEIKKILVRRREKNSILSSVTINGVDTNPLIVTDGTIQIKPIASASILPTIYYNLTNSFTSSTELDNNTNNEITLTQIGSNTIYIYSVAEAGFDSIDGLDKRPSEAIDPDTDFTGHPFYMSQYTKTVTLSTPLTYSISAQAGTYLYNYSSNTVTITITFNRSVTLTNVILLLNNGGTTSPAVSNTSNSFNFTYTIGLNDTNTSNLSIDSINSGSISETIDIEGSLGSVKILRLSTFGLSDTQNQVYTLKLASYGNRALSAWYHTSITPAYSNVVANVVGYYPQHTDSIKWKLTNISIVGNDLIADIVSTEQTVRTPGNHNGDYFSVAKHSQNTSDVTNFNYPTHDAPSTIGGEDRIKLIKQSSGIFYIQHSNNSYLINKDVWDGGGVVDPVGWESGTPGNIGKWTLFNY